MNETTQASEPEPVEAIGFRGVQRAANKALKRHLRGRWAHIATDEGPHVLSLSASQIAAMPEHNKKQRRRKAEAQRRFMDRIAAKGATVVSRAVTL